MDRRALLLLLLLAVALAATGCPMYRPLLLAPGARPVPRGRVQRIGCLDVAVQLFPGSDYGSKRAVLGVIMGNTCRGPVRVDVAWARIWGRYAAIDRDPSVEWHVGAERGIPMGFYDPRAELRPALLDGRAEAREYFEIEPDESTPEGAHVTQVCADVARVNADAPASEPRELCSAIGDPPLMEAP